MTHPNTDLWAKFQAIEAKLTQVYGAPEWRPHLDPISEVVSTILSQNTSDVNRDVAFNRLRERYETWDMVRDAPVDDIEDAIRPAGLGPQKAPRIKQALEFITSQRGELNIDFLKEWPVDEAKAWLIQINGIGPKTAAIVLLFALGRPALPVDTHVHRVTKRLGLIGPTVSADKAHQVLEDLVPEDLYYTFHLNAIRHGREICHARNPKCGVCFLRDWCDYYQQQLD